MPASPWPMPGRLDDHEVGTPRLGTRRSRRSSASGTSLPAARVASERKNTCGAVDRVHADAVAEQRAAAAAAGGVDGDDRDAQLVLLVEAEPADQLVGQRRLARAAGAGDAEHRHVARRRRRRDRRRAVVVGGAGLERGDRPGQRAVRCRRAGRRRRRRRSRARVDVALGDHRVDHPRQARAAGRPAGEKIRATP